MPRARHTLGDAIDAGARRLARAGVHFGHGTDNARDEAAWLAGASLGLDPRETARAVNKPISEQQRACIDAVIARRVATRKPAAYLLNEAWFAGLKFYVDERVIVPRSHIAEFILERFEPWLRPARVRRALDVGTGSGCIAIALAKAFPRARVDACDISRDALEVARINVKRQRVGRRLRLIESDLLGGLGAQRYDLIVTNPPYVARAELARLPREYRTEPRLALASGASGLDAVTRILAQAAERLTPSGILVAEVGNSAPRLARRFPRVPFTWLSTSYGDDSVFLLTAQDLARHRADFGPVSAGSAKSR